MSPLMNTSLLLLAVALCCAAIKTIDATQNLQPINRARNAPFNQPINSRSFLTNKFDDEEEAESLMNEIALDPFDFQRQESSISNARLEYSPHDKLASASHYHGKKHHGKYYQYVEVPKKGAFKMGFKRGNKKHYIERKEMQHGPHNKGYFKWNDKKGKGVHKWDYNHYDKKKHHGHHYG